MELIISAIALICITIITLAGTCLFVLFVADRLIDVFTPYTNLERLVEARRGVAVVPNPYNDRFKMCGHCHTTVYSNQSTCPVCEYRLRWKEQS